MFFIIFKLIIWYCPLFWIHSLIFCQHQTTFNCGSQQIIWVVGCTENMTVWSLGILWVVVLGCWMLRIRQHQMTIDTRGGTIMCSESWAMHSSAKFNSAIKAVKKKSAFRIYFVKEKVTATTISSAKTHNNKRQAMEILLLQMIGQFSFNFQNSRSSQ